MKKLFSNIIQSESGVSLVEYGIALVLIIGVCVAANIVLTESFTDRGSIMVQTGNKMITCNSKPGGTAGYIGAAGSDACK